MFPVALNNFHLPVIDSMRSIVFSSEVEAKVLYSNATKAAHSGERGDLSADCFSHCDAYSLLLTDCVDVLK